MLRLARTAATPALGKAPAEQLLGGRVHECDQALLVNCIHPLAKASQRGVTGLLALANVARDFGGA
ncbi:MAG: hypothetical protein WBX25_00295 [Rhodomicrobium sp.]